MFWIYNLSKSLFDQFDDNKEIRIPSLEFVDIEDSDVVFYYIKSKGFIGFGRVTKYIKKNIKNRIFLKDLTINNFYYRGIIHKLPKFFSTSMVFDDCIKSKYKYCNNSMSFTRFLIPKHLYIDKIYQSIGIKLYQFFKNIVENETVEQMSEHSTDTHELDSNESSETHSDIHSYSNESLETSSEIYSNNNSDSNDSMSDDDSEEQFDYDSDNISSSSENNQLIPIVINLCDKFLGYISIDNLTKHELSEHLSKCNKCEINDNNNINIFKYFNNGEIKIHDEPNEQINECIDKYLLSEPYSENNNKININYINFDNIYSDSLFITL